jgi:HAMP domain-containing protein
MLTHAVDLIRGSWRYARGLRAFLAVTLDIDEARRVITQQLQDREASFLRVLERGVYGNARSPYRRLLQHAGFEFADVQALVAERGLEGALSRLYDAGVYVTLDEFKGRTPVQRPGLEFAVSDRDFDNPLLTAHYAGQTSGSRGGGTRVPFDFDFFAYEAVSLLCNLQASGLADRDNVLWRSAPPATMGLRAIFMRAKAGRMPVKWYSPSRPAWNRQGLQGRALLGYTLLASRLLRRPIPLPEYPKGSQELAVVRYLADATRRGRPLLLLCGPSQWVRICLTAAEAGADISGTAFYGGGEPYTEGKAAVLARAGTMGMISYGMHEAGSIGLNCGDPEGPDDMHFMSDRLALLQRPIERGQELPVEGLFYTSLLSSAPKLMLNVESGDYAVVEERDCGCLWQELGLTTHIHHVRSYEKLTSEGVMFMGSMLHELLEETLPARFGGAPLDYQLVEEEEEGTPRVSIVVSPRIGAVDETAVIEAVLESVGFADWSRRMADMWREAGTLRVRRREPYANAAGKILPLHVLDNDAASLATTAGGR